MKLRKRQPIFLETWLGSYLKQGWKDMPVLPGGIPTINDPGHYTGEHMYIYTTLLISNSHQHPYR